MNLAEYKGPRVSQVIAGTLAAGASKQFDGLGAAFRLISSDGTLTIKTNNSSKANYAARQGLTCDASALFERIEIFNETGGAITFELFYGFGDFLDGTASVLGTVAVSTLPVTAATAARQDAQTALLTTIDADTGAVAVSAASIDAKTPALVGGAVPVTGPLTDAQLRAAAVPVSVAKVGAQANAANASALGAGGTSGAVDTGNLGNVSVFGSSDAATTITVQVSEDNVTFYDSQLTQVLAGAGSFCINSIIGARYVRIKTSGAATITATVSAKN